MSRPDQHGAAAAALSTVRMAGLQLLQAQSLLAPWVHRRDALPAPLSHGPVELLQRASQLSESPHASAKLIDDSLILLTYGVAYLQDHYDESERSSRRITEFASQMESYRVLWRRKALHIQTTWRTQRFHTNRLPVLQLNTSEYLQQDVQELLEKRGYKAALGDKQDSVTDLMSVPVEINEKELQEQVIKYAAELQRRVDARQRDADELMRQQLKEQRAQDDKRKRLALQKKKRYERACRQWHYFATKILRNAKQTQHANDSMRRQQHREAVSSDHARSETMEAASLAQGSDRTQAMMKVLKNPAQRQAIRRFVAKTVTRGVSRVLCAYNMGARPDDHDDALHTSFTGADAETTTSTAKVLRIGLLLCDLHFGVKYTGLYQRFFERVAKERGMRVEWQVFNCMKAQFPTKAHQRLVNGFLVAGGPNVGVINETESVSHPEEDAEALQRRRSTGSGVRNRHFGHWRQRLVVLLRDLYRGKQTILGGLGLGHVILAEALGGKIGMKEWEDGWNLLDPTIFTDEIPAVGDRRLGQSMQGIRFLHGEFVESVAGAEKSGSEPAKQRLKSWRCPGEHNFVSCFRDTLTLSMDGSPECGAFVFETLGEFYERERQQRLRQSSEATKSTRPNPSKEQLRIDEDEEEDDGDDFKPIVLDTSLSLEEKRKRLGVADASVYVARLFFDHFHRQILNVSRDTRSIHHAKMEIAGVVCSSEEMNVTRSIHRFTHQEPVNGIFLNVTASTDGHLVVTNPRAFALIIDQDRRNREQAIKQQTRGIPFVNGSSVSRRNSVSRPAGMTLQMLRDHDQLQCSQTPIAGASPKHASSRTLRLPSIRPDASTKSLNEVVAGGHESSAHRLSIMRLPSALACQRHVQASNNFDSNVDVLTLSQALSLITKGDTKPTSKRVFIRWLDEECKQTHDLVVLSKTDLRTLWLRLVAAIRIADLPNDQVAIVSRHSMLLDYLKRKRPTWTFVKDCRRSAMAHRKRLKKVSQYAAVADIILLDQEFLLSNSANENDAMLKRAHAFGLHLYVAPRGESPKAPAVRPLADKPSSTRRVSTLQKRSSRRSVSGLSKEISTKTNQGSSGNADYDMHVVEFMLLAFSGLDGVITSHPEAAVDALEKIAAKNEAMQQVEQIFRDWQAKDTTKAMLPPKRLSGASQQVDGPVDSGDPADYVAGDNNYDSDESVPESEIVTEISRQWAEHSPSDQASSPFASVISAGNEGGGSGGTSNIVYNTSSPLAGLLPSPFVPLRPLQPRPSEQVFGVTTFRRETSSHPSFTGEGRSQLRSIGSFRAAMMRTSTATFQPQTPPQGLNPVPPQSETMDNGRNDARTPEAATLKPMSTRKMLFSSR